MNRALMARAFNAPRRLGERIADRLWRARPMAQALARNSAEPARDSSTHNKVRSIIKLPRE